LLGYGSVMLACLMFFGFYLDDFAHRLGLPAPAFTTALAYYDSYRLPRLPANLLQAQRDYFGAHTYQRLDKAGTFHSEWLDLRKKPE
jgi:6-phosphogluconate dehydrogenase